MQFEFAKGFNSLAKETKQLKHNLLCTTLLNQGDKRTLISRNYSLNVEEFNSHEITQMMNG